MQYRKIVINKLSKAMSDHLSIGRKVSMDFQFHVNRDANAAAAVRSPNNELVHNLRGENQEILIKNDISLSTVSLIILFRHNCFFF